jgi:hypothetical protein
MNDTKQALKELINLIDEMLGDLEMEDEARACYQVILAGIGRRLSGTNNGDRLKFTLTGESEE